MANTLQFITLAEIKAQCRIEPDFTLEDTKLTSYGLTAEHIVTQYLGRGKTVEEMLSSFTVEYGFLPEPIKQAALLLVVVWYNHRSPVEAVNMSIVPYGNFDCLIKPYVKEL